MDDWLGEAVISIVCALVELVALGLNIARGTLPALLTNLLADYCCTYIALLAAMISLFLTP